MYPLPIFFHLKFSIPKKYLKEGSIIAVRLIHDTQCRNCAIGSKDEFMVQNISECCEISFITAISVPSVWSRG